MTSSKNSRRIRKYHKWFALIAGLQLMVWLISGTYMVLMDIDYIHGDHLIAQPRISIASHSPQDYSFADLLKDYPGAEKVTLYSVNGQARYKFSFMDEVIVLAAGTGLAIPKIDRDQAERIASLLYRFDDPIASSILYTEKPPAEIGSRHAPLWQVNFDDASRSSLYLSATTGELVGKRHNYWRLFDVMWMLHIMDYHEREDIHNVILLIMSVLGLVTALFGLSLTYISLRPMPKDEGNDASQMQQ